MKIEIKCDGAEFKRFDELENFQGNLKTLSDIKYEKMKQEIIDRGFSYPFYVWNNKIFDGHQRQEVIKRMIEEGFEFPEKVPIVNIQAENEKELAEKLLAFNEQYGEITIEGLKDFIDEYDLDVDEINKYDLPDIDWEDFEIPDMTISDDAEDDAIPEVTEEPVSERGKVYKLGEHRLMCGDSTSEDDVSVLMNGEKIQYLYTDPPYGINYDASKMPNNKNNLGKIKNDLGNLDLSFLFKIKCLKIIWGSYCFPELINEQGKWICWYKRGEGAENAIGTPFELAWTNCKEKQNKFYKICHGGFVNADGGKRVHPTQKPIKLAENCFNDFDFGKKVLDLFLGSGSTLIACQKNNRICYGMELDEHYCDVIRKRWAEYVNGKDCDWQELTPEE